MRVIYILIYGLENMPIENNNKCFVCGENNPYGFKVKPQVKNGGAEVYIECIPPNHMQGWAGILHGGIISTLLDEVITHIGIESYSGPAVTAQLEVRFRKPAPTGVKLLISAERIKMSRRMIEATAVVKLTDSTVIATGFGKVMPVGDSFAPTPNTA